MGSTILTHNNVFHDVENCKSLSIRQETAIETGLVNEENKVVAADNSVVIKAKI
uniref:Pectate lyase n=1 Tax=Loa loa TaxID=7209 RepID=A0A1I7VKR0_LOALO